MRLTISLGDQRCLSFWMTYARRWSSRAIRLLPFLREEALSCARLPAENARYPLVPLLRFTSRDIVLGARSKRLAIAEILSPCARPRLISSRSVLVRRRYLLCDCCIRIYCTHIRCVKSLTPSIKNDHDHVLTAKFSESKKYVSFVSTIDGVSEFVIYDLGTGVELIRTNTTSLYEKWGRRVVLGVGGDNSASWGKRLRSEDEMFGLGLENDSSDCPGCSIGAYINTQTWTIEKE